MRCILHKLTDIFSGYKDTGYYFSYLAENGDSNMRLLRTKFYFIDFDDYSFIGPYAFIDRYYNEVFVAQT